MAGLSSFPESIDSFVRHYEVSASEVPYVIKFQELKLKINRTPEEETELGQLATRLRPNFISSEDFNKFQDALVSMQVFIRDNVAGYIDTARDNALIAIDQKKNAIIVYLDSLEAGRLRNDLGVMDELTTVTKSSLVAAINEVRAMAITEASTSNKGIVRLNDSIDNSSVNEAATSNAIKKVVDYADQRVSVGDIGITTNNGNSYSVVTLSGKPTNFILGTRVSVKINAANTASATLSVNGSTPFTMKNPNGTYSKLKKDGVYSFIHDGSSSFFLQGEGGSGNAIASDLLSGKTASTDVGDIIGSMPNMGNVGVKNLTIQDEIYTIPKGYHDGNGAVQAVYKSGSSKGANGSYPSGKLVQGSIFSVSYTVAGLGFTPRHILLKIDGYESSLFFSNVSPVMSSATYFSGDVIYNLHFSSVRTDSNSFTATLSSDFKIANYQTGFTVNWWAWD